MISWTLQKWTCITLFDWLNAIQLLVFDGYWNLYEHGSGMFSLHGNACCLLRLRQVVAVGNGQE